MLCMRCVYILKVPGPSTSLRILRDARLDADVTDVMLSSEHENFRIDDDMSYDGEMLSKEIHSLKGTSKHFLSLIIRNVTLN